MSDARPVPGASVALMRAGKLLLVRRAQAPAQGLYAFPGGKVEFGETLRAAALRELAEETGMSGEILAFIDHNEIIGSGHYIVACFLGRWLAGEGAKSDEVEEMIWLAPDQPAPAGLAAGMAAMLARAFDLAARMKL
ncbi:MAG: NUDIX domain-containing protein [Hyphomicrobiales bacterium]|nr:NUDIX domain-containing protein [Hyphomicrobiales bacterium]